MTDRRTVLKYGLAMSLAPGSASVTAQVPERITRTIPSSGEQVPVVGIGTNRYSRSDTSLLTATLRRFAEFGGGAIDTAPEYGNSESVLGRLISELDVRDRMFLATKCDVGGSRTSAQMGNSARALRTDVLDLVAVHNMYNWEDQLPVLREARQDGRIRYLGVTVSRDRQHAALLRLMESESLDFVQLNYSLADRAAADRLLPLAADKGIAVMVNVPFGRGRLFPVVEGHDLPSWAVEFDCESWGQFFLKYIVSHPAVTVVIPGTTKDYHLVDNMGAAMGRLPDAEHRAMQERFIDSLQASR